MKLLKTLGVAGAATLVMIAAGCGEKKTATSPTPAAPTVQAPALEAPAADTQLDAGAVHIAVGVWQDRGGLSLQDADRAGVHVAVDARVDADGKVEYERGFIRCGLRGRVRCHKQ